mgnify:CR=1 FL=1
MCHISCKESKNRHPAFVPVSFFFLASNHLPSQVSNSWRLCRFLLLPLLTYLQERGNKHRTGKKENVRKRTSPIKANGISPSPFLMYRVGMKSATDISKAVLPQRKYPTSDNRGQQGKRVMCSKVLWTTFHFSL